jgi:type IV pilus assembly protein PilM
MANPFSKIFESFKDALKKSPTESVMGIDIGSSAIKVVQIKKKGGKAILETYGTLSLGPYANLTVGQITNLDVEKLSEAIKDVLRETSITTKRSAIAIPSSSSLIFTVDLPSMVSEADYATAIPTEARKYIPVPITEVSLDYWPIPKAEQMADENLGQGVSVNDKNEVLVVAIHNDVIKKYQDIVKKVELDTDFFEIEIFSSIRSELGHEMSPVLILDLGASKTKLSIVEHGIVRSFHIVNRGGQDMTFSLSKSLNIPFDKAEEMKRAYGLSANVPEKNVAEILRLQLDYIFSESQSVLLNFEKKYNKTISKVIMTGGGALMHGFKEYAMTNFRNEVILGDPFAKTEAPAFLQNLLSQTGPEFAVAIGVALRDLE